MKSGLRATLVVSLILGGVLSFSVLLEAQQTNWTEVHAKNDAEAARQSGLTIAKVRELRQLAGVSDESSDMIDNIDSSILAQQGMLVFATYGGSARCVNFWVFSRSDGTFKPIWSIAEAGDKANFCADPRCSVPVVKARNNRDVVVEIPSYRAGHCAVRSVGLFQWNGTGYTYEGVRRKDVAIQTK